jgi:hypothetical protein
MRFTLPLTGRFAHKHAMSNDPADKPQSLIQWAMKPPQAYAVYLVAVLLVFGLSFFAGTFKPKQTPAPAPAATPSVPRS